MASLYRVTSKISSEFKNLICNINTTSDNLCASTLVCPAGLQQKQ